tara:strand:- start:1281 stop:1520 length:240 start_codon:yes stop_codon:yes gene_type:complete
MTEENNKDKKKCGGKGKAMFAYGIIQLGSSVVSAISLAAIAFNFSSLQKEAELYNNCVEEVQSSGKSSSISVRYCNGGK